jgi:hypothetical protein
MAVTVERERVEAHRALVRGCARCGGSGWIAVGPGVTDGGHLAPERVQACECTKLRRLEILGRRPWPVVPDDRQLVAGGDVVDPAETAALMTQIESRTGLTIRPRSMPDTTPATDELRAVKNVLAAAVVQLKADKAAKQVLAKIVESMRRCEELERQVPDAEEVSNG